MSEFKIGDKVQLAIVSDKVAGPGEVVALGVACGEAIAYVDWGGETCLYRTDKLRHAGEPTIRRDRPTDARPQVFESSVRTVLDGIRDMLVSKNAAYGDSALNPVRVFSKADAAEQIRVRIDDKISRLQRGSDAGEDTVLDLLGYLVLLRVAEGSHE